MENYAKTILSAYPMLDSVITQIENLIRNKARNSFYVYDNTQKVVEQILRLGEIAKLLYILKVIVDDTLLEITPTERELISFKYFGIVPERDNFDHVSRNYFRKQIKALNSFCQRLKENGHDENWFKDKYLKIAFIAGIYKKTLNEEGKKHVKY
ncbi:MAG: hypothetical protein IKL82_05770 [Clostridia bacterium]|nr:hypothetical protein [Clostridia bacterium]